MFFKGFRQIRWKFPRHIRWHFGLVTYLPTSPCLLMGKSCTIATVLVGFTCTTHYLLNCFDCGKCLTMLFTWIKTQQANTRARAPPAYVASRKTNTVNRCGKSAILDEIRWIMKSSVIERILQNAARIEQGLVKDYGRGTPKNAVRHRETVQNTI